MKKLCLLAIIVEIIGISSSSTGLLMLMNNDINPAYQFITAGSILIALGGFLFSKVFPLIRGEMK